MTRSSCGYELLVCSSDGTVAFFQFEKHEMGDPMSVEDKVCVKSLERYPSEGVQCSDSIRILRCSEKHEEKISNMISYTAEVKCKS